MTCGQWLAAMSIYTDRSCTTRTKIYKHIFNITPTQQLRFSMTTDKQSDYSWCSNWPPPRTHDLRLLLGHPVFWLSRWQTNDKIARFYRRIFSVKLEPSSTAKFIADKIGRFCRSCVIQKSADFLSTDEIGQQNRPILSFVCHRL